MTDPHALMGPRRRFRELCVLVALLMAAPALSSANGWSLDADAQDAYSPKQLADGLSRFQAVEARFSKGRSLFAKGDLAGAAAEFEACAASMPEHVYSQFYRANIYYIGGDYPRALEAIERAEGGLPFVDALDEYARGQKVRAMDDARYLLESENEATRSCRESRELEETARVVETDRKKLEDEAARLVRSRADRTSLYAGFHGNILFQLKRFDEAYAQYRKAVEANPGNGDAWNNAAALLVFAGRAPEAAECLERATLAGAGDRINPKLRVRVAESLGRPTAGILEEDFGAGGSDGLRVMRFSVNVYEGRAGAVPLYVNTYVVHDEGSGDALIIDPGAVDPRIEAFIAGKGLKPRLILNTHGHYDHGNGNAHYAALYGIDIAAPRGDRSLYEKGSEGMTGKAALRFLSGEAEAGTLRARVFATPGHTPGGTCFLIGAYLFTGDSLFEDGIGRLDSESASGREKLRKKLVASLLGMLGSVPATTVLLPGHGKASTVSGVLSGNPYLAGAN